MKKNLLNILSFLIFSTMFCHAASSKLIDKEQQLAKEIASVKEQLNEYKISQSFTEAAGDVALATAIGAGLGALGGGAQALILNQLLSDISQISGPADAANVLTALRVTKITNQAFFGACAGFVLGFAGQTGFLPKLSFSKLILLMTVQNIIAAGLNIAGDCIAANYIENFVRMFLGIVQQGIEHGDFDLNAMRAAINGNNDIEPHQRAFMINWVNAHGQNLINAMHRLVIPEGRRGFCEFLAEIGDRIDLRLTFRMAAVTGPVLTTAVAQILALLIVIPEVIIVHNNRKDLGEERDKLKESLSALKLDLQYLLYKMNEDDLAEGLEKAV